MTYWDIGLLEQPLLIGARIITRYLQLSKYWTCFTYCQAAAHLSSNLKSQLELDSKELHAFFPTFWCLGVMVHCRILQHNLQLCYDSPSDIWKYTFLQKGARIKVCMHDD